MTEWTIEDEKALLKKLIQSNVNELMKRHKESEGGKKACLKITKARNLSK
jgi:hypothetical protein